MTLLMSNILAKKPLNDVYKLYIKDLINIAHKNVKFFLALTALGVTPWLLHCDLCYPNARFISLHG